MGVTGARGHARPQVRTRLLVALAALCLVGASPVLAASAAHAAPAQVATPTSAGPASAPAVPTQATFVAKPQIAAGQPNVRQACATPSAPGQMACMALISRRHAVLAKVAALRVDAAPPAGTAFGPPQLQNAYGLSGAASDPSDGETVAVVDAYNDPEASSDLDAYRSAYGLGTCDVGNGCLKIVNQNGAKAG